MLISNQIEIKDLFGRVICVLNDASKTLTIKQLKENVQFLTGVNSKYIKLMDKIESIELEDSLELIYTNGKCCLKSSDNPNNKMKEIDIYLSYLFLNHNRKWNPNPKSLLTQFK